MRKLPKLAVRLRGGFSDRNGMKIENTEMQYTDLDDRTRTAIINLNVKAFDYLYEAMSFQHLDFFLSSLLESVYLIEKKCNTCYDYKKVCEIVNQTVREDDYDSVLTVVEYLAIEISEVTYDKLKMYENYNHIFEAEYVGYRFVNKNIVPITDSNEIESINDACSSPYEVVNHHLSKAVSKLSDRKHPDYENSIKESISAVEALCEVMLGITGKEATLGKMLKKLEKNGVVIHTAMKSAFNTLYGYTSDANGIRHAGDIGGPASTFDEAKFMLVSCSAFINYLIGVSAQ